MVSLRAKLLSEIILDTNVEKPSTFYTIKREFHLTGTRKQVLEKFTRLIEERL